MGDEPSIIHEGEERSLHYPFPKNKRLVLGNLDNAFARIKQNRSGKPHVTGTLPLNVAPDQGEEIPEATQVAAPMSPAFPGPAVAAPARAAPAEKAEDDADKEALRKQRKKERRLARKAKKKAEAAAAAAVTDPAATQQPTSTEEVEEPEADIAVSDSADFDPEDEI